MLHTIPLIWRRATVYAGLALGIALVAGCAQDPRPTGYYDTPHDSTLADAEHQAQGHRGTRAPSQVQVGFGDNESRKAKKQAPAASSADANTDNVRPLLEAKTFLGTVPCVTSDTDCPASRITLTLAPNGEWRSRTVLLGAPDGGRAILQQGCWAVTGNDPLRIVIRTQDDAARANFTFVNDNVLRINMYNDVRPMLDYHLTRQPDIDPIDEIAEQAPMICN